MTSKLHAREESTSSDPSEPIIHPSEADVEADVDTEENLRPLSEPSSSRSSR
jgi:hypothetical protein